MKDKAVRYGEESDGNFHSDIRDQALVLELFALFDDKRAEGVATTLQDVFEEQSFAQYPREQSDLANTRRLFTAEGGSGVKAMVVSNQGTVELSSDKLGTAHFLQAI